MTTYTKRLQKVTAVLCTTACWWSQEVGNWENAKDILSLLYDENSGIGLNIYRYNLGAGSKDDTTITDPDRRAEAFIDKDGSYHWERDAAAQNALALAKSMNKALRVTLRRLCQVQHCLRQALYGGRVSGHRPVSHQ